MPALFKDVKGGESEHINLKVLGQDNTVVQFKIKKHTPLRKLMSAYCERTVSYFMSTGNLPPFCLGTIYTIYNEQICLDFG